MNDAQYHPSLLAAARDLHVRQRLQAMQKRFVPGVPYDGLDWNKEFGNYYRSAVHNTHMMGLKMHKDYAATKGIKLICPANDPKQPTVLEKLDELLDSVGDIPMMVSVGKADIHKVVPRFKGKRCVLSLFADSRKDALEQMETIHTILDV